MNWNEDVCFIFYEGCNQEEALWKIVTGDLETASHLNQRRLSLQPTANINFHLPLHCWLLKIYHQAFQLLKRVVKKITAPVFHRQKSKKGSVQDMDNPKGQYSHDSGAHLIPTCGVIICHCQTSIESKTGQQEPLTTAYAALPLLHNTTAQMLGA